MKKQGGNGKIDLHKDGKGNIVVKGKGGKGEGELTGYNINDIVKKEKE